MREKICTVKRSCSSKRRPKVMTGIGRAHPTSGSTRHTTAFSLTKKRYECLVLLFYQRESHLTTSSVLQLALLPRFFLLILNSADARWAGWGFADGRFAQQRPHLTVNTLLLEQKCHILLY